MSNVVSLKDAQKKETRVVPHSLDVEQALLGVILINNDVYQKISGIVSSEDFHEAIHARIFSVLAAAIEAGNVADPLTLRTQIGDHDLGGMTSSQYLARLAAEATPPRNAVGYAKVIRSLSVRRSIILIAEDAIEAAYDAPPESTVEGQINAIEDNLGEIRPRVGGAEGFVSFATAATRMVDAASVAYMNDGAVAGGLSTGLPKLDNAVGGLYPGDFLVLAGRPGSGKSALAVNIAHYVSEHVGHVAFFSLEMPAAQLVGRVVGDVSAIPYTRIRKGRISEEEFTLICDAVRDRSGKRLWIDDSSRTTIAQIGMRCRMLKKRVGLSLVVVDYLQLVSGSERRKDSRYLEIGEITAGLKALSKDLDTPVIALAQLSRNLEQRDNKRPQLQDLRESGSIEQDADIVAGIYREEYYLSMNRPQELAPGFSDWQEKMEKWRGVAEIAILKQRNGPPSTIMLGFKAELMRFENESPWEIARLSGPESTAGGGMRAPREKKTIRVSKIAAALLGVIRSLALNGHGTRAETWMRAQHDQAIVVPYGDALDRWKQETLFSGEDEAGKKKFREAFVELRAVELAFGCGDKDRPFVYLTEQVGRS